MSLKADAPLELTATLALSDALALAEQVGLYLQSLWSHPRRLEKVDIRPQQGLSSTVVSSYWLHNLTGTAMEYWIGTEATVPRGSGRIVSVVTDWSGFWPKGLLYVHCW